MKGKRDQTYIEGSFNIVVVKLKCKIKGNLISNTPKNARKNVDLRA